VELAARHRLPAIYALREFVEDGGLMSYAASLIDQYRRAARYVDKILKGAKPGDLPVEQPIAFELWINVKAAKVIDPPSPRRCSSEQIRLSSSGPRTFAAVSRGEEPEDRVPDAPRSRAGAEAGANIGTGSPPSIGLNTTAWRETRHRGRIPCQRIGMVIPCRYGHTHDPVDLRPRP
jgi:ABC transporter substrate binding protein